MIATVECPNCGAENQVLTIGFSDSTTCNNCGEPIEWRREEKEEDA